MNLDNTQENNAAVLRTRLRAERQQLPDADRRRGALLMRGRLFTWLAMRRDADAAAQRPGPQVIAAYWPMADEPDLRPLLEQWCAAGLTVALPIVTKKNAPLTFRAWTPDTPMQTGAYGIAEPQNTAVVTPDVLLVPTLGYTDQADRLGYGGGYYDRTLAALRDQGHPYTAIGIAWGCGHIDDADYQPAPHDMRLDAVLTPEAWIPSPP